MYFHIFQLPDVVDLELDALRVMVNKAYLWIIRYSQDCFLWNFVFYSKEVLYFAHKYKKMLHHPWSYKITIDENPLQWICVLSYLCLLLTKVLFEISFKSFWYNTKGRRLSNYLIQLNMCSHYCSRYKGLCQNIKHVFCQQAKGGPFCATHITLITFKLSYVSIHLEEKKQKYTNGQKKGYKVYMSNYYVKTLNYF